MAKHYDLVGSVYDKYAKGNKYKEEEIIKIPGVTFNSLEDIDKFTASFNSPNDLRTILDKKYQMKDIFAIRVTRDNENFYYKSVIYDNPDLVKIASSLKQGTIHTGRGPRTVKMYLGNNSLFINTWDDVLNKILKSKMIEEEREWLYNIFGENSGYTTLIKRYVNGDAFDNETNKLLGNLETAFREYKVFRKYLTNKDKNNKKNKNIVSNVNITTPVPVNTKLDIRNDELGNNYIPIDDYDKEEFFEDDEIALMSGGDGNVPHKFTGRRI